MPTDVQDLIARIQATRDKLNEEIQPQRDAIAETEAEIARLDAMLSAYEGTTEVPKAKTVKASRNGSKPDGKTITEAMVRKAQKDLVKLTADDENPHTDALNGFFRKAEYATALDTDSKNKSLDDSLKALVASDEWTTTGKVAGLRYGPKATA